jgi:hypothetical protein
MNFNAFILDWSMDHYPQLRQELTKANFTIKQEEHNEHIRVAVPFMRVNQFSSLCQAHLNSPFNYVDIQYPNEKKTIIVFKQETFIISSNEENERVRAWAIQMGLPEIQADWTRSF